MFTFQKFQTLPKKKRAKGSTLGPTKPNNWPLDFAFLLGGSHPRNLPSNLQFVTGAPAVGFIPEGVGLPSKTNGFFPQKLVLWVDVSPFPLGVYLSGCPAVSSYQKKVSTVGMVGTPEPPPKQSMITSPLITDIPPFRIGRQGGPPNKRRRGSSIRSASCPTASRPSKEGHEI